MAPPKFVFGQNMSERVKNQVKIIVLKNNVYFIVVRVNSHSKSVLEFAIQKVHKL